MVGGTPKSLKMVTGAVKFKKQNKTKQTNTQTKKRFLLLAGKKHAKLHSILKNRDITLLTKVHLVKAMVFLVVMCVRESCTINKADH